MQMQTKAGLFSCFYCAVGLFLLECGQHTNHDERSTDSAVESDTIPFEWQTSDPESAGMDKALLDDAIALITAEKVPINSMIIVKAGRIVLERYFDGGNENSLYQIESTTKSIVSLLVGMAIEEGLIDDVDAPVLDFFSEMSFENPSAEKTALTVKDLLTMQSGLDYDNNTESFLDEPDSVQSILNHQMKDTPGAHWAYSSADTQLLGAIIEETSGMSLRDYAAKKLFDKLDLSPGKWQQDASGRYVGGFGLELTPRDMAKIGLFMLSKGVWNGERLVSKEWIDESLIKRAETSWTRGDFGYSWWIKPFEGYCAGGRFGQQINFFPKRDLVVVYTASLPIATSDGILDKITQGFVLGTIDPPEHLMDDSPIEDPCGSIEREWVENSSLALFASGVATVGDTVSTRCLRDVESHSMCLFGVAANAGSQYENWGAAMELELAKTNDDGSVIEPFDADAEGIRGVKFTLSGDETLVNGLRVGVSMVNQDNLQFEYYPYVVGGSWSGDFKTGGALSFTFDQLGLPDWTPEAILEDGRPFDPKTIKAIRFQAVTQPGGAYAYDFCISDIQWLDENLDPIGASQLLYQNALPGLLIQGPPRHSTWDNSPGRALPEYGVLSL